ncbi:expressed unknown protein [Seminavis robusta]|uniref:Uncharacterized protein n=1 Tax=Seminavis robusta TaxID=568900 RepID=A0A9N8DH22_9STRA|nr:expressed unknown protein [Seminavis robusta]|eukprot:Sro155_g070410.1 n/a (116) ;mRNA; r:34079-34426
MASDNDYDSDDEEQQRRSSSQGRKRGQAAGGNEVSAGGYCYALCWFLLLLIVAWPLAIICAIIWVLIQPCEACIDGADGINRCLYPWLRYPRRVGRAIHRCDAEMPKPVPKPDNA